MWNRVEVKAKGKAGFKRNYWNCVVASLLFTLVSGGLSGNEQRITRQIEDNYMDPATLLGFITSPKVIGGAAVGLAIGILVFGALEVGCSRFFLLNQLRPASVSEVGYGFNHNYWNNVGTILLRNVFVILGVILFIIPGVIMSYQYRMVPYILSEKPELGPKEALDYSKKMMEGHKLNAFIYDFSFIGWILLSMCTLGIAGIFYTNPYKYAADAELYLAIRSGEIKTRDTSEEPEDVHVNTFEL